MWKFVQPLARNGRSPSGMLPLPELREQKEKDNWSRTEREEKRSLRTRGWKKELLHQSDFHKTDGRSEEDARL
jgi:hypothetical protein